MALERTYTVDLWKVACKGSRELIYPLAALWLARFSHGSKLRMEKIDVLLLAGLFAVLSGIFLELWGEFFRLPLLLKRILGEILLTDGGTALVLYALALLVKKLAGSSSQHQDEAEIDQLTGLYNRRGFLAKAEDILAEAQAWRCHPAVAFLDIDRMKEINDTWGRESGDVALKQAAGASRKAPGRVT